MNLFYIIGYNHLKEMDIGKLRYITHLDLCILNNKFSL
jgi:hypothetical protein